jgi:hypothetical protein
MYDGKNRRQSSGRRQVETSVGFILLGYSIVGFITGVTVFLITYFTMKGGV